jgi:sulfur carrier protein
MEIKVNGQPRELIAPCSLLQFLESLRLTTLERGVAVCVNGEVVRRADWNSVRLQPEDELEIVQAAQGG